MRGAPALFAAGCAHSLCLQVGPDFSPSFEDQPCPEAWGLEGVSCGVLHTAATLGDPGSCRVDVGVVDLAATDPSRAAEDPAILLPGGPGQVVLYDLPRLLPLFEPWRAARPVWLVDPRGGGASTPSLRCDDPATERAMRREADPAGRMGACADHLRDRGLDLDAYRTTRLAQDVATLAHTRGVSLHVVGGSYGTRWAQTLLDRHPEVVSSVLLDSPAPWSRSLYTASEGRAQEALDDVFAACARDVACTTLLPDPQGTYAQMLRDWSIAPRELRWPRGVVATDADGLRALLFQALKSSKTVPLVPALVAAARDDDLDSLSRFVSLPGPPGVVPLLHHAITCADAVPFTDVAAAVAAQQGAPAMHRPYLDQAPICAALAITPSDASLRRVPSSDVPILVTAGALDPLLPPLWAVEMVGAWPEAHLWVDPSSAHGVLRSACGKEVAGAFLADPQAFVMPPCAQDAVYRPNVDLGGWLDAQEATLATEGSD